MYVPKAFGETDAQRLYGVMEANSFAALVNVVDGSPFVTHLPLLLDREKKALLGHLASANPQARALFDGQRTLAVFQGPHAYISPSWYVAPNVPTWNYVAVHAYGVATPLGDTELEELLERLTAGYEPQTDPWRPQNLPADMLAKLRGAITGFALPIERLEGKYKLSQNRGVEDRRGASDALRRQGVTELADLMDETLPSA